MHNSKSRNLEANIMEAGSNAVAVYELLCRGRPEPLWRLKLFPILSQREEGLGMGLSPAETPEST